jgi:hypothetical protein
MSLARRRGSPRGRLGSPLVVALSAVFLTVVLPVSSDAQEQLALPELELAYRASLDEYSAAFRALEVLEMRFGRASEALRSARNAGDKGGQEEALAIILRLGPERTQQELRVGEKAREVSAARGRLLEARSQRLEEFLGQAEIAREPDEIRELAILVQDMRFQIAELRAQEDPEVSLEPEPYIVIEPRDGYEEIRDKADLLDLRGDQYEDLLGEIDRTLAGLRRDLRLMRRSDDFVAGVERFGDIRLPVGPPGARPDRDPDVAQPPAVGVGTAAEERPLTLEERIQALEITQREVVARIESIRVKAESFRRQIRLDMAGVRSLFAGVPT